MSGKFREEDFVASSVHASDEVFDGCGEWCVWVVNAEEDVIALWGHSAMAEMVGKGWDGEWGALRLLEVCAVI